MTTWLTASEGGEYAKVSEWTIRQAVKDGDLPAYPVGKGGRSYRVTAEEIDEWMLDESMRGMSPAKRVSPRLSRPDRRELYRYRSSTQTARRQSWAPFGARNRRPSRHHRE